MYGYEHKKELNWDWYTSLDAHPRPGEAQSAMIAILAWFLFHYKSAHQAMLSLVLDLFSSSFW